MPDLAKPVQYKLGSAEYAEIRNRADELAKRLRELNKEIAEVYPEYEELRQQQYAIENELRNMQARP